MGNVISAKDGIFVTDKEIELVQMLSDGHRNKSISEQLAISVRTVEDRLDKLRAKTGCKSLPQLVAKFIRDGVIE